jgi:NAD(P)-dependent dehydrogenase (short-subunit alcohol dehydrogenase family)
VLLQGKVVLITGATKGIGRGIALHLAAQGAKLCLTGRDITAGEAVVEQITAQNGSAEFYPGDITNVNNIEQIVDAVASRWGKLDGLVNNAGIFPNATLLNTPVSMFDEVFAVNIRAAFYFCQFAIPLMIAGNGGSIVHIGSTHAYGGSCTLAAYACSKGALLTLSKHIAQVYASQHIRSNWITVGWVATEGELAKTQRLNRSVQWLQEMGTQLPFGRLQEETDVAYGTAYLLSDMASQVTGTELQMTGGFSPDLGGNRQ